MVSKKEIIDQLKKIGFKHDGWGRSEVSELPHIIIPSEEIYECVNGIYDGGFALLVATNVRVLLIDKKPLNYLTVEDMRFDMISEMDYNNRLFGADISISSGGKNLHFRSYNQAKLRKLISHVQGCMAEAKRKQDIHQEGQVQHLEQINKQLQAYLIAQQQYQQHLTSTLSVPKDAPVPEPPKPSHELADFLYAQRLLAQHNADFSPNNKVDNRQAGNEQPTVNEDDKFIKTLPFQSTDDSPTLVTTTNKDIQHIYEEGLREVYAEQNQGRKPVSASSKARQRINYQFPAVINPINVAISKLPEALRIRKFGLNDRLDSTKATSAALPYRS